ncbi:AraC family transcriptional regulator [Paenibacillus sp. MWE-103]|uniref:AraC family transcriptional regulator n=1 Tax=Paenibacillus artemisiicola TaxID=1172618 RepID=A0ABS3WDL8_9BACL|nr:AraC family transcriptional regulator [Paenibacillus artemisiicola]MBO7746186.1 AraC family transcriptional regulator [Paenibacillus artemisiicola]
MEGTRSAGEGRSLEIKLDLDSKPDLDSKLQSISPFVRMVKISESSALYGEWVDYDHVFTYIDGGEAEFILDGVKYPAKEGDMFLMPPFMPHLIRAVSDVPLVQYIVQFDLHADEERRRWKETTVINETTSRLPARERLLAAVPPASRLLPSERLALKRRFAAMLACFRDGGPYGGLLLKAGCIELLHAYLASLADRDGREGNPAKGWATIERAIRYMNEHYGNPRLSNREIGRHIGVSANYLSSLFKEQIRVTMHKYLTHVRIEQAKQRLQEGRLSMTAIAEETGFSSIHMFSRAFKSAAGVPPSRYAGARAERPASAL